LSPILLFVAGFTVVFTLVFGLSASPLSRWLRLPVGQRIAGGFIIAFGLLMILYSLKAPLFWLYREGRPLLLPSRFKRVIDRQPKGDNRLVVVLGPPAP